MIACRKSSLSDGGVMVCVVISKDNIWRGFSVVGYVGVEIRTYVFVR